MVSNGRCTNVTDDRWQTDDRPRCRVMGSYRRNCEIVQYGSRNHNRKKYHHDRNGLKSGLLQM